MYLNDKEARLVLFLRKEVGLTWRRLADVWQVYEGDDWQSVYGWKQQHQQAYGQSLVALAEEVLGLEVGSTDRQDGDES